MAYAWAGSFAETRDGLPFIGRVPGMDPRLQFALCYGGNGITYSVHAGDIIRAGIEGRAHALDAIFGFGRLGTGSFRRPAKGRGRKLETGGVRREALTGYCLANARRDNNSSNAEMSFLAGEIRETHPQCS